MRPHFPVPGFIRNYWNGRPADDVTLARRRIALPPMRRESARVNAQLAIDRAELRNQKPHATRNWWATHVGAPAALVAVLGGVTGVVVKAVNVANNLTRSSSSQAWIGGLSREAASAVQNIAPASRAKPKISASAISPSRVDVSAIVVSQQPQVALDDLTPGEDARGCNGPMFIAHQHGIRLNLDIGPETETVDGSLSIHISLSNPGRKIKPSDLDGPVTVWFAGNKHHEWRVTDQSNAESLVAYDWSHGVPDGTLATMQLDLPRAEGDHEDKPLVIQARLKSGVTATFVSALTWQRLDDQTLRAAIVEPAALGTQVDSNTYQLGVGTC